MKWMLLLALLTTGLVLTPPARAQEAPLKAVVLEVVTGDQFTARLADGALAHVRLADVQAPEVAQPGGNEAMAALATLIAGQKVDLQPRGHNHKGHLLAVVILDKQDVAKRLLKDGWLWLDVSTCRDRDMLADMAAAAVARKGIWLETQVQAPWAYRAEKKIAE